MMRALLCCLMLVCSAMLSCHNKGGGPTEHAFYYWKTSPDKGQLLPAIAEKTDCFYVRYFDVDWSESRQVPIPVAELKDTYWDDEYPFIARPFTPVVFITNRTLQHTPAADLDTLATRIADKISRRTMSFDKTWAERAWENLHVPYGTEMYSLRDSNIAQLTTARAATHPEIQIDCDWTAGTREAYFTLLKKLKARIPGKTLSVTIRLYPYKYRDRMGVPPVDRGMLMCYNLGRIGDAGTTNSVFDEAALRQYLNAPGYPLPLDYALPVFGWAVWLRGGTIKGILHEPDTAAWTSRYKFRRRDDTHFVATEDNVEEGNYFREGDELRLEYPDPKALEAAADLLSQKIPHPGAIAFFHWDVPTMLHYEDVIQTVFRR